MDLFFKFSLWLSAIAVFFKLAYNRLRRKHTFVKFINEKMIENVLIVTAHPDDECMFFGPAIRVMAELGCNMQVLCLSKGLGVGREEELQESCRIMGIAECTCIDDKKLIDGMNEEWDQVLVKEYVLNVLQRRLVDLIVTFDNYGVSGHSNHIAVSRGTTAAFREFGKRPVQLVQLESVWLWRKYLGFLNYGLDAINNTLIAVPETYEAYWIGQEAMKKHASQLQWFRKLYLIFSRYLYINSFVVIKKN